MAQSNDKKISPHSLNDKIEERFNARAVSRGFAIGKAVCLHGRKRQFYRIEISESQIADEIRRFRSAISLAVRQLKKFKRQKNDKISRTKLDIFSAHLLILEDKSLHKKVEDFIESEKVNSEWAVKIVSEELIAAYKKISDERLRERYIDLEDVAERILAALGGGEHSMIRLERNSIIVAKEVKPSTLIELTASEPQAIVTENGGWTSHTFILAREMGLPAVTGVKSFLRRVKNGDEIIIDAFAGKVILHPQKNTTESYTNAVREFHQTKHAQTETKRGALKTLDGYEITVRANLDLPKGYAEARKMGAKGIGLYRSEFLFNQFKGFPTEQEQITAYRNVAELVGDAGVRIRTFDLSLEQLADETEEREKNPALGLRAIRLGFSYLKEFRTQIRALLQASAGNRINVILPMISDVAEIIQAKQLIKSERNRLRKKNIESGDLRLGAMIEVPSAVFSIDEIAAEVDFLCLGTNDLVQYLLAVDRDNELVADWFRTLHPSALKAIKIVIKAAEEKEIPVIICGEMAGSPVYVPILIGLGATEISMNVKSISRVAKVVSEIALEETRELIAILEKCRTADAVESAVTDFYQSKWSHLFPRDIFPPKKNYKI